MERPATRTFRVGAWWVNPASGEISRDGEIVRLEVRTLRVLVCLAERAGDVVSIDDVLKQVWPDVVVSPDSVYQAVASLRRVLGDDPKRPAYIATVPRLGYRMVAAVSAATEMPATIPASATRPPARAGVRWAAGVALGLTILVAIVVYGRIAGQRAASGGALPRQTSVAVLPFQDLTEGMKQEEFADGMTEELIDRLGKIPGLRVPPPTSSFSVKGKRLSVADVAARLGVAYVLDGSTRKSGNRVRVAVRLIRADHEVVVWSETYDRAWGDILSVQDDIAGAVATALSTSIERS